MQQGDNNQTIKDFGEQWLRYRDNEGYYGSLELFSDILSPFLKPLKCYAEILDSQKR